MPSRPHPAPLALLVLLLGSAGMIGCGVSDFVDEGLGQKKDVPAGESMTVGERERALTVLRLVNEVRAGAGRPPLAWDEQAADVAYDHAVDMRLRSFYAHENPDGDTPLDRMLQAGVEMDYFVGENIALRNETPEDVVAAWMASPGHRATLLAESATHLGVGVHDGKDGPWWVQEFFVRLD